MRPRGHRGGIYPLPARAMCVIVRDLIVFGVLTDMMRGGPAVYATFSSYDEVAHHSGSSVPTRSRPCASSTSSSAASSARRYAPRPYEIVVLSDHGQTQGATFKQRNGYGLDELVERSLTSGEVETAWAATSRARWSGTPSTRPRAAREARQERRLRPRRSSSSAPGNLGPGLPDGGAAPPDARGDRAAPSAAHPGAAGAPAHRLAARPLRRARRRRGSAPTARTTLATGRSRARTRSPRSRRPRAHLLRTDGFAHVADIMVGSFYDPDLDEAAPSRSSSPSTAASGRLMRTTMLWGRRDRLNAPCSPRSATCLITRPG